MKGTTHQSLGEIEEINVTLDDGDGGWARAVVVAESGDMVDMLIPKDEAHNAALALSPNVTDVRFLNSEVNHSTEGSDDTSSSGSDRNPLAWAFEFRPKIEDADWHKKVEFSDPRESWCTYGDMEVRNIQPLYTDTDGGQADE